MKRAKAIRFCERWLPRWTGNRPERLVDLYADDAFYRDPARPEGIRGRDHLLDYFRRLLARYPDWRWTVDDVFPIDGGFVLRWRAEIPVRDDVVRKTGLDIVLVRNGLIERNEVYFDRVGLLGLVPVDAAGRSDERPVQQENGGCVNT